MASGMETLLASLLKSMGFNPQDFVNGIQSFIGRVEGKLNDFEARLAAQERLIQEIHAATVAPKMEAIAHDKQAAD